MSKKLIIGCILTFLALSSISPSVKGDGKPDLIITGLGTRLADDIYHHWLYCVVKNIGSGTAYDIDVKVEIKRVMFGVFLINKTINSYYASGWSSSGLPPNNATSLEFALDYQLHSWGFFRLYCQVNPDKRIEETDYTNNYYTQDVFVLFGNWAKAL